MFNTQKGRTEYLKNIFVFYLSIHARSLNIRIDKLKNEYLCISRISELLVLSSILHGFEMNTADAQDILGLSSSAARDESVIPAGGLTDVDRKVLF